MEGARGSGISSGEEEAESEDDEDDDGHPPVLAGFPLAGSMDAGAHGGGPAFPLAGLMDAGVHGGGLCIPRGSCWLGSTATPFCLPAFASCFSLRWVVATMVSEGCVPFEFLDAEGIAHLVFDNGDSPCFLPLPVPAVSGWCRGSMEDAIHMKLNDDLLLPFLGRFSGGVWRPGAVLGALFCSVVWSRCVCGFFFFRRGLTGAMVLISFLQIWMERAWWWSPLPLFPLFTSPIEVDGFLFGVVSWDEAFVLEDPLDFFFCFLVAVEVPYGFLHQFWVPLFFYPYRGGVLGGGFLAGVLQSYDSSAM
ncbi:hypothetical protein SUGI_0547940 [Cryptomeria japonica]|nr:hypothetical protein SUGI_0547940 [Cryptomeria japonica]